LVDFNLQIGANAFLCVLVAGLLAALARIPGIAPARLSAVTLRPGAEHLKIVNCHGAFRTV